MIKQEPDVPEDVPEYLSTGLDKQSPETLRDISEFAKQLAEWKEAKAQREMEEHVEKTPRKTPDEWEEEEWLEAVEEARDDADLVEHKGTLTTKTIDGRDYYYLQWREGSKIKSEYVAPVVPANSNE